MDKDFITACALVCLVFGLLITANALFYGNSYLFFAGSIVSMAATIKLIKK